MKQKKTQQQATYSQHINNKKKLARIFSTEKNRRQLSALSSQRHTDRIKVKKPPPPPTKMKGTNIDPFIEAVNASYRMVAVSKTGQSHRPSRSITPWKQETGVYSTPTYKKPNVVHPYPQMTSNIYLKEEHDEYQA